jgi:hypothetical protein
MSLDILLFQFRVAEISFCDFYFDCRTFYGPPKIMENCVCTLCIHYNVNMFLL